MKINKTIFEVCWSMNMHTHLRCEQAEKRRGIMDHIARLEALQPATDATADLRRVAGTWKLLFSTISITVRSSAGGSSWPCRADCLPASRALAVSTPQQICTGCQRRASAVCRPHCRHELRVQGGGCAEARPPPQ